MLPDILYNRFYPRVDLHLLPGVIQCYIDVFADHPWNEWKICPKCETHWGSMDEPSLQEMNFFHEKCGVAIEDYYTVEKVEKMIFDLNDHHGAVFFIAVDKGNVIAFCWGYPVRLGELEGELKIEVSSGFKNSLGITNETIVAYQNELGVRSSYRKNGVATQLFLRRHAYFLSQQLPVGFVRTRETNPGPSQTYTWFIGSMEYKIATKYPEKDGRVVLAQRFDHPVLAKYIGLKK